MSFGEVAGYMGYNGADIPSPVNNLIIKSIDDAANYCDIQGGILVCNDIIPDHAKKSIHIAEYELNIKGRLFNEIKDSEKIALFLCTAGSDISNHSKRLMDKKDMLEGYILDIIGSVVVERAMDQIQEQFGNEMKASGYRITNRYSPGYCGWKTNEQFKLFNILPRDFCGVRLTESALMIPIKSISGIIGIGLHVEYQEYHCELCDAVNCIYRDKK